MSEDDQIFEMFKKSQPPMYPFGVLDKYHNMGLMTILTKEGKRSKHLLALKKMEMPSLPIPTSHLEEYLGQINSVCVCVCVYVCEGPRLDYQRYELFLWTTKI